MWLLDGIEIFKKVDEGFKNQIALRERGQMLSSLSYLFNIWELVGDKFFLFPLEIKRRLFQKL